MSDEEVDEDREEVANIRNGLHVDGRQERRPLYNES